MKRPCSNICQFKIILGEIVPSVWRRIQISEDCSFWDLHVAIQDSMGWQDRHLHVFELSDPITGEKAAIGMPNTDPFDSDENILPGWIQRISDYFVDKNAMATYEYDFGDGWRHEIVLEQVMPKKAGTRYPVCVAGERACPPEDCGGVPGYQVFLDIIMDPTDKRHKKALTWAGGEFHPEHFDPKKVRFCDPTKRLNKILGLE